MKIFERSKVCGEYEIRDETGRLILRKKNVVVQNFFTAVLSYLNGTTTSAIGVTKFGAGTGTTTAMKTDTALVASAFEKSITSSSVNTTQYKAKIVLAPAECNFRIREIGLFAGTTLISRVNIDVTKNASTQLTVTWILTIE